jgi:hypothetical protein
MKKIIDYIVKQAKRLYAWDKFKHAVGTLIVVTVAFIVVILFPPVIIAIGAGIAIGLGKEYLDEKVYGGWSNWDLLADGVGILFFLLIYFLLK